MTTETAKSNPDWINIRIDPALRARLEACAERNLRALGREATIAIREYVDRQEKQAA